MRCAPESSASRASRRRRRPRVFELLRPVLLLEVGAVDRGTPRRVDPHPGRPAGAGAQQGEGAGCRWLTANPGMPRLNRATVRRPARSCTGLGSRSPTLTPPPCRSARGDQPRRTATSSRHGDHDEHRQRPGSLRSASGTQTSASATSAGTQTRAGRSRPSCFSNSTVLRVGRVQHGRGRSRCVPAADRDPYVGQVGVDTQTPVAGPIAPGGGRRHALPARGRPRCRGSVDRRPASVRAISSAMPMKALSLTTESSPASDANRGRAEPEPAVGRIVQGPGMLSESSVRIDVVYQTRTPRPSPRRRPRSPATHPASRTGQRSRTSTSAPANSSNVVRSPPGPRRARG